MDHAGFLLGQPQPQRGQDRGDLLAQSLGVLALASHHDDKVVGEADKPPVAQAVPFALGPLHLGSHLRLPLPGEVVIQR